MRTRGDRMAPSKLSIFKGLFVEGRAPGHATSRRSDVQGARREMRRLARSGAAAYARPLRARSPALGRGAGRSHLGRGMT